jgi:hypothetical protein
LGVAVVGSIGVAARGCRRGAQLEDLENRVARIEAQLGIVDAGAPDAGDASPTAIDNHNDNDAAVAPDDSAPACAVAKVSAYRAWQDVLSKAKVNAGPATAACVDIWNDKKKQACYYAAYAPVRATQAARDAVMKGGAPAREAVKAVKDDPRIDAIARARGASEAAFAVCHDDGEF